MQQYAYADIQLLSNVCNSLTLYLMQGLADLPSFKNYRTL